MSNYNSSILLKCFQDKLPCIYGVYAIQRETKNRNLLDCENNNIIIQNPSGINYFKFIPYDIILLIIDMLYSEHDIMNFCIGIQKCDKNTLDKLVYWYDIYCFQCKNVKLKYVYCHYCKKKLCGDCIKKCPYCDDNLIRQYDYEQPKLNSDTNYEIQYYSNPIKFIKKLIHCADLSAKCAQIHRRSRLEHTDKISNTQYHWSIRCDTCECDTCYECIETPDPWSFKCKKCAIGKELLNTIKK
jgi:hypothetical protein